jgi:CheY-like chemotaxis protein
MVVDNGLSADPFTFSNGLEALHFLMANSDGIEENYLLLLDINMPVMNGWELLEMISEKGLGKSVYVVILTSSIDDLDRKKAFTYDRVMGYIEKPLNRDALKTLRNIPSIQHLF